MGDVVSSSVTRFLLPDSFHTQVFIVYVQELKCSPLFRLCLALLSNMLKGKPSK